MCVCATGAQFSSSPHATSSPHARPGYALPQQQQQQQQSSLGASIGLRQPGFQQQGFQHPQGLQQGYQQPQGFQQGFQQPQGFGGQFGQAQSYGQPSFQVIRSSLTHMCQACCMHVLSCSRLACQHALHQSCQLPQVVDRQIAALQPLHADHIRELSAAMLLLALHVACPQTSAELYLGRRV